MMASGGSSVSFPVSHSLLDPDALRSYIFTNYDIGRPTLCAPFPPGINDSYLVRTDERKTYILSVYRAQWRTLADIHFELDALRYVAAAGLPVSVPIAQRDGAFTQTLRAPEGDRQAILFTFALGKPPDRGSPEYYRAHGRALAKIHAATVDFRSLHPRPHLEPTALITWSLAQMAPYFSQRPADWTYLCDVAHRLGEQAMTLGATDWGMCHGDPYIGNAHITDEGTVTFFDFDCCGLGWRAYDLAGVRWFLEHTQRDTEGALWAAFLAGYRAARAIADADLATIPYFVAVRTLWHNALGARASSLGIEQYDDFCKRGLAMLKEWETSPESAISECKNTG